MVLQWPQWLRNRLPIVCLCVRTSSESALTPPPASPRSPSAPMARGRSQESVERSFPSNPTRLRHINTPDDESPHLHHINWCSLAWPQQPPATVPTLSLRTVLQPRLRPSPPCNRSRTHGRKIFGSRTSDPLSFPSFLIKLERLSQRNLLLLRVFNGFEKPLSGVSPSIETGNYHGVWP